jgi:hypothetical protein
MQKEKQEVFDSFAPLSPFWMKIMRFNSMLRCRSIVKTVANWRKDIHKDKLWRDV